MKVGSNLEKILTSGQFAATGELGPPPSADAGVIQHKAGLLKGHVDAVNVTDCQTAVVRMSSISVAVMLLNLGIEPTVQMTCRDRNRIAIQSDLLGAAALGMQNLLCLTGDHQVFGNHPESRNVFDLNSMQLLRMVKDMRDEKKFQCGGEMKGPEPRFFIGAAANPFADPFDYRPHRLAKKVQCGADFIQTQIVFNAPKFREYMKRVVDMGVHEQCYILAGVAPIKSYGAARYMATRVPGMDVPDEIVQRMKATPKEKQAEEGIKVCIEIIQQMREIPGVAGVHIMAIEWEESVAEITAQAGLLPRPVVGGSPRPQPSG
ncbi:MAG: methylenetetrahydrofolate reductase [Chloroflexota bacterium]|nr:methylenetetrahydrofolate reductase [Chloroflexota bacterium]